MVETMANELADETMDSLLKEIDDEMENNISLRGEEREKISGKWSIPLQEIGDDTMDMIVSHNTINNITLRGGAEPGECQELATGKPQRSLPSRKSVVFSEGVNLHEYQDVSDERPEEAEGSAVDLVTKWKKSTFTPAESADVDQSLIVETHSDSEQEEDYEQPEITTQDLLQHTVNDLDQKLSHMLDKKRNVRRLKLMTEEMAEREFESERKEKASPIKFTLQPTKPLIPSSGNPIEESSLIHFQSMEDLGGADDEEDNDDSCSDYMNEVLHSPSKIPLVNTVNINKFSVTNQNKESQTRVSSGSSCCDSIGDLKTTIQHDSYKLLGNDLGGDVADSNSDIYGSEKPLEREEMVTSHPNTSRIFSVATSGEGYRSANESVHNPESNYSSEEIQSLSAARPLEAAVKDIGIPEGLLEGDNTTQGDEQGSVADQTMEHEEESQIVPKIPDLPLLASPRSASSSRSASQNEPLTGPDNSEDEKYEIGYADLHDVASPGKDIERQDLQADGPSKLKNSEQSTRSPAQYAREDDNDTSVKIARETASSAPEDTTKDADSAVPNETAATVDLRDESAIGGSSSDSALQEKLPKEERKFSALPSFAPIESIFLDDPFIDEFETSGESIDLTKSVKPSNYLSIWHMQEEDIRTTSPAISSNSQFSRCTESTNTSASVNSNIDHTFKFKPRIVSRSKIYYPESRLTACDFEDDRVISNFETALDPLRRNTVISRKIQENINSRRKLYPSLKESDDEDIDAESLDGEKAATETAASISEVDAKTESHDEPEKLTDGSSVYKLDLLPSLPDAKLKEEFMTYLEAVGRDNRSILDQPTNEAAMYNVWDQQSELEAPTEEAKNTVSMEVIQRLLEQENKAPKPVEEKLESPQPAANLGFLKTPVKEVSVGRGLSLKGYEALISTDVGSERQSALFSSLSHDNEVRQSPLKETHVESPFKAKPKKQTSAESSGPDDILQGLAIQSLETEKENRTETSDISQALAAIETYTPLDESKGVANLPLPDRGNIYLKLNKVVDIMLQGVSNHKAQFAIEFDNGKNVVQTPWEALNNDRKWEIEKEFEIILDNDLSKVPKLVITLKCRYESPKSELREVVEKVPVGRKFPFGKSKYQYRKRFVQMAPDKDDWDYLFARDGSFGRCEVLITEDFLKDIKFQNKSLSFTLINEWARKVDSNSSKKLHELPRRSPYAVGTLKVEACHLERTSPLEKFPITLAIAQNIISKYKTQQAISKEGYLLQEGGDLQGGIQRRFFKLQGINMLGYHEITGQPKVDINLLKVVNVFGPGDMPKEGERNLTDLVLFSGCFHLIFDNGEKIAFSPESAAEEAEWSSKIKDVIDLNRCHQPWVKNFAQNFSI